MTIDHEGRITESKLAAERTFGYSRAAVLGKLLADVIIPPSLREAHRAGLARYPATGEATVLGWRLELAAHAPMEANFPSNLQSRAFRSTAPPLSPVICATSRSANGRRRTCDAVRRSSPRRNTSVRRAVFRGTLAPMKSPGLKRSIAFSSSTGIFPSRSSGISRRVHPEDIPLLYAMIERARSDSSNFLYESRLR